ncbi:MAG: zinc-binding alcohol dehydrogenase family protein [Hyphomicrobiales bacterium]|nr:MAG: zinc-binding alcohol dehydrogenase family protein [Hyphomicrobiales bacterium]
MSDAVTARALRLEAKAADPGSLLPTVASRPLSRTRPEDVIVEIAAAAVNPSDVKAAIGMMPYAVFPRTPGRDFAGRVIAGPAALVGREVFGTGGDVGIRRDGSHATHLVVDQAAVVPKPASVSMREAAGIGVPFVTAAEGYNRAGLPKAGETVLVLGANGKVGQAAIQIATAQGANVIGVVRRAEPYRGHASGPVTVLDASAVDVGQAVRDMTGGRGADIVFNTVGDPYYEAGTKALAVLGRQIFIAAINKIVSFDIFAFYRGRHTYVGIDTLALTAVDSARLLSTLVPGFESGQLKPFPVHDDFVYGLDSAKEAYLQVIGSSQERVVLVPG